MSMFRCLSMASIKKGAQKLKDKASDAYDDAKDKAKQVAAQAKEHAAAVKERIKEQGGHVAESACTKKIM